MPTDFPSPAPPKTGPAPISLSVDQEDAGVLLRLSGRLEASALGRIWTPAVKAAQAAGPRGLTVDAAGVEGLDGAGAALLLRLRQTAESGGGAYALRGLHPSLAGLLDLFDPALAAAPARRIQPDAEDRLRAACSFVGAWAMALLINWRGHIAFTGEMVAALYQALRHPRSVRWKDVLVAAEKTGVNSLPIIGLIGFLMGLIMSFQSAVTLKRFGGEVFIPNGLGLLCFRELSALITAILLAGRSGSAFAAEIGTMKVNEEVDALVTMGLSPVRFLVGPKMLATIAVMPIMCLFFDFFCLLGGAVVMLSLGFPMATYTSRVFASTGLVDFAGGMFKGLVFAILVAGVGCRRGLHTGEGASAVGDSTTSAVVLGIILVAVADGVFAVLFYYLGW